MRTRAARLTLTAICIVLGIMLVTQLRTQSKIQRSVLSEPATNQALIISSLYDNNLGLRKESEALIDQLTKYDRSTERSDLTAMADDLNRLRVVTGLSEVAGPGVELRVVAPLTAEDVRDLVNELRNAGAEAIAVNEHRMVAQSAILASEGILYANSEPIQAPFSFAAIGQPETVERALVRKGGVLAIMENAYPDGTFIVSKKDKLVLPVYQPGYEWKYAKVAN